MNIIIPNKTKEYITSGDSKLAETKEYITSGDPSLAKTQEYITSGDPRFAETQEFHLASGSKNKKENTRPDNRPRTSDSEMIMNMFSAQNNNIKPLIKFIELGSKEDSPNGQIVYLNNLFNGQFTEVNDEAFSHLSVLAKDHGVTEDELHDFFENKSFYENIKDFLRVDQSKPTLLEPSAIMPKSKKSLIKPLVASFLVTIGVGGGTHAIVNSGKSEPSGMSHKVVVEPITQLHQPSSTKTLTLNDKSNTFEELQQYFAQNPDENSNWSAVYNLINVSGIADEFSNRKIEIVDFETYNGSHRFELGGQTYTLNNYNEQIVQQNVFPPCVHLRSSQGTCLFNQIVINKINESQYDLRDLQTITLPELLNTSKYGRGALADEARRNNLFSSEFQKNTFTTKNYRLERNQQLSSNPTGPSEVPQRMVQAKGPIKTISSSKTEGN